MKRAQPISRLGWILAACALVGAFAISPSPARAVTVFWDAGLGVSQTTATNASVAGIPLRAPVGSQPLVQDPTITRDLDESTLAFGAFATITSNWTVSNNTGTALQDVYAVFLTPLPSTIFLDGNPQGVTYDPSDVGAALETNWVIFQVELDSIPVYFPAVSLGTLAAGANAVFPLHYVLDNPQVFSESFNYELGLPKWDLTFVSVPVPEPASGVLLLAGLLCIARGRSRRA
jgi:hypothetical protein